MRTWQCGSLCLFRAVALCACFTAAYGCGFWRTVPNPGGTGTNIAQGNTLRLRKADQRRVVRVVRVDYPLLEGVEDAPQGPAAVVLNLTDFDEVEVYDAPRGLALTSLATVLGLAVAGGAAVGIFYAAARRGD